MLLAVADAVPLARVLGERLRFLRTRAGVPQEAIAAEARRLGLGWAKSSVAALEAGRRALTLEEGLLLPVVLARAGIRGLELARFRTPDGAEELVVTGQHPVGLMDLLPEDDRPVRLADGAQTTPRRLRALFAARGWHQAVEARPTVEDATERALWERFPHAWLHRVAAVARERYRALRPPREWDDARDEFFRQVGLEAASDAVRKAAVALGVPPLAVAFAARALWPTWGLVGERDHRLKISLAVAGGQGEARALAVGRVGGLSEEDRRRLLAWSGPETDLPPRLRRTLQALRGHCTRQLLAELRPLVQELVKKRRRGR